MRVSKLLSVCWACLVVDELFELFGVHSSFEYLLVPFIPFLTARILVCGSPVLKNVMADFCGAIVHCSRQLDIR